MSLFGAVRLVVEAGSWAEPRVPAADGEIPPMRPGAWARWWRDAEARDAAAGDAGDPVGTARLDCFAVPAGRGPSGCPQVTGTWSEDVLGRPGHAPPDVVVIERVATRSGVRIRLGAGSSGGQPRGGPTTG